MYDNVKDVETLIEEKRKLIESEPVRDVIGLICVRSNIKIETGMNKILRSFRKLILHNTKEFKKANDSLVIIQEDIRIIKMDLGLNGNGRQNKQT
jgi:hypothetical protein